MFPCCESRQNSPVASTQSPTLMKTRFDTLTLVTAFVLPFVSWYLPSPGVARSPPTFRKCVLDTPEYRRRHETTKNCSVAVMSAENRSAAHTFINECAQAIERALAATSPPIEDVHTGILHLIAEFAQPLGRTCKDDVHAQAESVGSQSLLA